MTSYGEFYFTLSKPWIYKNNGTLIFMSDSPFYSESVAAQLSLTEANASISYGIQIPYTTISNNLKSLFTWMPAGDYVVTFVLNNIYNDAFDEYVGIDPLRGTSGSTIGVYGMKTTMTVDANGNITTTLPTSGSTTMQTGNTVQNPRIVLDLLSINIQ